MLPPGTPVELLPGEEEHKTKGQGFYLKDSIDQDKVKRSLSLGGGDGHQATYLEEVHGKTKLRPVTTPSQPALSMYPLNLPNQHTRSTHPLDMHSQPTLSIPLSFPPFNTPYQPPLLTLPVNPSY